MNAPQQRKRPTSYHKVDMYERKLAFAQSLGYANLAEAIADLTEPIFNEQFTAKKKPRKKK